MSTDTERSCRHGRGWTQSCWQCRDEVNAGKACPRCGYADGHSRDCTNSSREEYPAIGDVSEGKGELTGGDVQAVRFAKKKRRPTRHDQRTPLPGDPGYDEWRANR